MMVEEGDLVVRVEGSARIIRLNRPKAINAVTLEMLCDIKALDRFEAEPTVSVVLLEGADERGLRAGGDIRGASSPMSAGPGCWRDRPAKSGPSSP